MALRVLPRLLYGPGHAYGNPGSGSGYESSLARLTREDLAGFHRDWFKPDHATLVVVGDTTVGEMQPKLERLFRGWEGGAIPRKNIAPVDLRPQPALFILDKPGSPQSLVLAGQLAPPASDPERIAIETMNFILGGDFISRLNMNIREEKHWSYGAGSFLSSARGQQPFIAYAPVQADKTRETIEEIRLELEGMLGAKPISFAEYENARNSLIRQLPGQWETMAAVEQSLVEIVRFGLPDDYYSLYPQRVLQLKIEDLERAARKVIHPASIVWVVVGDRALIEAEIRDLGPGEVFVIDSDGQSVK
jgi:zinc protease